MAAAMTSSADGTSTTTMPDYYASNCFWVELDDLIQAYFMECSGLSVSTETYKVKEGGLNTHVHNLPDRTTFTNVTLKTGYTLDKVMWEWYKNTVNGTIQKKNVTIITYDQLGNVTKRWQLTGAYPVKWSGPTWAAKSNEVMTESLELCYDFFQLTQS